MENFAAFGQIVPMVMISAVVFPICDVLQGELTKFTVIIPLMPSTEEDWRPKGGQL
jgi:hypothetical protein